MAKITIPKSFKANVDRALHNLYQEKRTTLHPMTAIPLYYRRLFRGDVVDFNVVESLLQSEPTFAPLLANWRLEFQWYFDSDANRYGWIDNNTRLTAEEYMTRKHHTITCDSKLMYDDVTTYSVEHGVGRGGVMDYAGVAPTFLVSNPLSFDDAENPESELGQLITFNADFWLTYLNIIRNYHVNKQYPNIPYIAYPAGGDIGINYETYPLEYMDNLFMFLRSCPNGVNFNLYGYNDGSGISNDAPSELSSYYGSAIEYFVQWATCTQLKLGGLFCTQFEPDLYQNLLSKDQQLMQSVVTIQDVAGQEGITIEQFRLKNHLQGLYDKLFVSGGTDRDASRTIWGIESNRDYDIPELLCVHSEIIGTNLVESSTAGSSTYNGEDVSNAPGSMSGNINSRRGAGRTQKFTAKTAGNLMCIVTLTPLVDYCQNIERHLYEHYFMDEFTPDMARKGFENVPLSDYCALPACTVSNTYYDYSEFPINAIVGKQVAWLREMTATNRVHGEFSNGGEKRDWVLVRSFTSPLDTTGAGRYGFFSPYGKPNEFQYPFVATDLESPNFYLQVGFMVKAYRPVPRRFMPNLGY